MQLGINRIVRIAAATAVTAILLGAPQSLKAQDGKKTRSIPLEKQKQLIERHPDIDANGDGTVTPEEARAYLQAHPEARHGGGANGKHPEKDGMGARMEQRAAEILKKHPGADTDGDGKLSPEEARAFMQTQRDALAERLMKQHPELDKDGDGTLSPDEMLAAKGQLGEMVRAQMKQKLLKEHPETDTNKDGRISDEELKAYKDKAEAEHRAELLKRFPEADKDHDGKLSDAEVKALKTERDAKERANILTRFPDADTNKDGQLNDQELKAFKEQHRGQRPGKTSDTEGAQKGRHGDRTGRKNQAAPAPAAQ